jgi:hypothetical protein
MQGLCQHEKNRAYQLKKCSWKLIPIIIVMFVPPKKVVQIIKVHARIINIGVKKN